MKEDSPKKKEGQSPSEILISVPYEFILEMEKDEYLCYHYEEFAIDAIRKYLSDKKNREASDELKKVFDGMIFKVD